MRAFLLAGGRGERLRPLTLTTPKCLVPIDGVPLLGIWLDLLDRNGITDVLVNVSHHVDQVRTFLRARPRGPRVELVVEPAPMGTAGTVVANRSFIQGARDFWILYADNLTDLAMAPMLRAHREHGGLLTMGLFRAPEPSAAGIVSLAADGRVIGFEEKPAHPQSNLANAGVYVATPELLECVPHRDQLDFGLDVFPALVGRLYGYVIDDFLMDVGTPITLDRARRAWPAGHSNASAS